jgi:hypothetical protein
VLSEAFSVTLRVARVLEELGVPYFVGGSLASSYHGIPRATQDADLIAALRPEHVAPLVARLREEFYVDDGRARQAIERQSSFNVIFLPTMFKVDLFVLRDEPHAREEMARRQPLPVEESTVPFASAEDTLLHKIGWYRLGGGISERQWYDALGILKVQGDRLDHDYLRRWAEELDLSELLAKAVDDAAVGST